MMLLGRHLIVEFFKCDPDILNNCKLIEELLVKAATAAGFSVITSSSHLFEPHGVSSFVLIGESHISVHTWPEYNCVALDIFVCGKGKTPWKVFRMLQEFFKPKETFVTEIKRGFRVGRKIITRKVVC